MGSGTGEGESELVWLGMREIRDVGGAIGQSWDIEALRELGLANDEGELRVDEAHAKTAIYANGLIEIDLSPVLEQLGEGEVELEAASD